MSELNINELNFTTDTLIQIVVEVGEELLQQTKEQAAESEAKNKQMVDDAIAQFSAVSEENRAKLTALWEKLTQAQLPATSPEGEVPVDEQFPSEEVEESAAV